MGATYSESGVDIFSEYRIIKAISSRLEGTFANRKNRTGEVMPSTGHFANYVRIGSRYFVLCTDGVGTKVLVAQMMDRYNTIGIDMIAMNVNDMICVGAEPIAMVDYLAFESHDERIAGEIAEGMVTGANQAAIAIIGGETATLKGVITGLNGKGFDLAGTCMGVVDADKVITGMEAKEGDYIVGLASSGIHSNGLTLAREALLKNMSLSDEISPGKTVGGELLAPTRIYVKPVLEMLGKGRASIHAMYNITGSGFLKFNRLRKDIGFRITALLPVPKIFSEIKEKGRISDYEMFKTFNMGMGFAVITDNPSLVTEIAARHDINSGIVGRIDGSRVIRIEEKDITYKV